MMETYDNYLRSIVRACYWINEASKPDMFKCKHCGEWFSQDYNPVSTDICLGCEDAIADAEREKRYGR